MSEKKEEVKNGFSELINNLFIFLSKNVKYIVLAIICVFFGIVISWKADKGACLINCNFQDNSHNYYFREKDVKIEDILKSESLGK